MRLAVDQPVAGILRPCGACLCGMLNSGSWDSSALCNHSAFCQGATHRTRTGIIKVALMPKPLVNIIPADVLAANADRASAGMIWTKALCNHSASWQRGTQRTRRTEISRFDA